MAYTVLPAGDIVAGKPTKEEIFDQIRTNQESFNTDIEALKQTSIIQLFNIKYGGNISQYTLASISERIPVFRAPVGATIVSFKAVLLEASTSGTLEIEIDRSTDEGINFTPLLDNPVEITGTTVGSISGTVDFVDVPSQSFAADDLLRIRLTAVQVDQGEFHLSVYAELS